MPWVERLTTRCGLKGRETVGPAFEGRSWEASRWLTTFAQRLGPCERKQGVQALAAFQAARMGGAFFQGIGLRPQPWAGISRPVGPAGRFLTGLTRQVAQVLCFISTPFSPNSPIRLAFLPLLPAGGGEAGRRGPG